MSNTILKNTRFRSEIRKFFRENQDEILDIILFGSLIRGKEKPKDIDILVIYHKKKDIDTSYILKKILKGIGLDGEIIDKTYKELFHPSFIANEAILSEGYSLINNKFISEGLGYLNLTLFNYELKGFTKSDRMRFYYSLYGRNNSLGLLKELKATKFSDTIILCPVTNTEKMRNYLFNWKIEYIDFPILIPNRLKSVLNKR